MIVDRFTDRVKINTPNPFMFMKNIVFIVHDTISLENSTTDGYQSNNKKKQKSDD